ncbi:MAG: hypothetical protein J3R72DRAFT_475681 [Linnemannia gamsii]|nr:MAG: hypothetical protein J3R72DRAFT_475681 [Linnemannia gamsii]
MKALLITTAFVLATTSTTQAVETAFGPHFGLSYVYDIVHSVTKDAVKMMTKHKNYKKAETNYFVRVGTNGIGDNGTPVSTPSDGSSGMDGPFPIFEIFDATGTVITKATKRTPHLDSGEYNRMSSKIVHSAPYYRMKVTAGDDGDPAPNAACISSIAVSPDEKSGGSAATFAIPAELIISVDSSVPWYYSGQESFAHTPSNDCLPVRIPGTCFWLSQFVKKDYTPVYSIEVENIAELVKVVNAPEAKLLEPGTIKITRSIRPETPAPPPPATAPTEAALADPASAAAPVAKRANEPNDCGFAYLGSESAKFLCHSLSSVGPNFVSTSENLYCDMTTRKLYPRCKSADNTKCYRIANNAVSVVFSKPESDNNDLAENTADVSVTLSLRALGSSAHLYVTASLMKRAECVKGTSKAALSTGETLASTDYVTSTEGGSFRLVVLDSTGDVIVYGASRFQQEPSSIAVWKLGASGPQGSYVADVNANGQICSRTTTGVVLKCVGPKSAAGPTYQLQVNKGGAIYIKNGETVIWTTDPYVTETPPTINGIVLTESNSFHSLDSAFGPKTLTSTNGKTTLEFKDGSLCLYNDLKVQTWCLPPPAGTNPDVRYTLTTRGSICILRTTGGPLNSSCTGNQGDETSYFAVVCDDGFLRVYNSAEEQVWQNEGEHS